MRRSVVCAALLILLLSIPPAFAQEAKALPQFTHGLTIDAPALKMIRTMSDVDMLTDGRIVVLDHDARRVAIFSSGGQFERWLDPPRGVSPEVMKISRLVTLPNNGVVLADWGDTDMHRFIFYDSELRPQEPVPFGREVVSINGFVRHPSGDLYLVGYSPQNGKILHRFDAAGAYRASYVQALDVPDYQQGMSTGYLALDPIDNSLWLSRLTPYEILHLSPDGEILDTIRQGPGAIPKPEQLGNNLVRFRTDFHTTLRIAVIGDFVVNSYLTENNRTFADVFTRNGTLVAAELTADDPRTLAKRLGNGQYVRHFNADRRVEIWRAQ